MGTVDDIIPDKTKEQIGVLNSRPNAKALINEQMNRWRAEIDADTNSKNNLDIIPRINSEHMRDLKRTLKQVMVCSN
jgi:hypothetical protein